jgi:hypothetical protein
MKADGLELFIYYRVAPGDAQALRSAVRTMQSRLCAERPGLRARLLHRPDLRDGLQTWMEIYALAPGDDVEAAALAIERGAERTLGAWLASPRHVERFVACA